jgi:16S rRNA (uracil1498-N3)-methyltransferase
MQKYFISKDELKDNIIIEDSFHIINVMRFKVNDKIIVSDNDKSYLVEIRELSKNKVRFERLEAIEKDNELPFFVDIYQGLPKSDKLDDILKHSTELGVNSVCAVISKRSIVKIDPKKEEAKTIRYNKIMKEASEQSLRMHKSTFIGFKKLKDIDFSSYDLKLIAFEEDAKEGEKSIFKESIQNLKKGDRVCVFIGPEGGIDLEEIDYLKSIGFKSCALGPRILRTETASMYVLSAISYESELK